MLINYISIGAYFVRKILKKALLTYYVDFSERNVAFRRQKQPPAIVVHASRAKKAHAQYKVNAYLDRCVCYRILERVVVDT